MPRLHSMYHKLKVIVSIFLVALCFVAFTTATPSWASVEKVSSTSHAVADSSIASSAISSGTGDMTGDVIYQLVTDRFYDGDTSNDNPSSAPNEYSADKSNWQLYWGGDFQGVTDKMSYLKDMGIGAIWISPPVQNISSPAVDSSGNASAGYHGYWGMDFYVPDPHFGSWQDFDTMVTAAHNNGIKIIMDWAINDTSPEDVNNSSYANDGALLKNGTKLASYSDDPSGYFHHNGGVTDYNDQYQVEYKNLFNLADLAQENSVTTEYLKDAVDTWLSHGVDGIRMDAVKHMPSGFLKSYADNIYSQRGVFLFGEWADTSSAALWQQEVKLANADGMSLENFDLNTSIRDVFASGASMAELDSTISRQQSSFDWSNQLVDFVDGQDVSRFLSINNSTSLLDQATVVNMTVPGIPSLYYGDEQYTHDDSTNSSDQVGGDPYNRDAMSSFSENTRNFKIVQALASLRKNNPALRYGSSTERWINNDVYVYERKFYNDVVLVAVNKGNSSYTLNNLNTSLPNGSYSDNLSGLLGGGTLTVGEGSNGTNPVSSYTLNGGQAAVWSYVEPSQTTPEIGDIGPTMGRSGDVVSVTGSNFGSGTGTVNVGGVTAVIDQWSPTEVDFTIPQGVKPGSENVVVTTTGSLASNSIAYNVLSAAQTATTFTVTGTSTSPGDELYLTGNVPELGSWNTDSAVAIGPMLCPNYPTWFTMASLPAGLPIQYKFFVKKANGTVQWEGGSNHTYTAPSSGTGAISVAWQD